MLTFNSASVRIVNSQRAIAECLDIALPDGPCSDIRLAMFICTLGHKLDKLGQAISELVPGIAVLGNSASGTIGREGVGESMSEVDHQRPGRRVPLSQRQRHLWAQCL